MFNVTLLGPALVAAALASLGAKAVLDSRFPRNAQHPQKSPKHLKPLNKGRARNAFSQTTETLSNLAPVKAEKRDSYQGLLARAGLHMEVSTWRGIELVCIAAGALLGLTLASQSAMPASASVFVALLAAGIVGPRLILMSLTRDRRTKIEADLAPALEMLAVTVRSGYPVERGMRLIAQNSTGPIAQEFQQVDTDINLLGMDMERALRRMMSRCNSNAVSSFALAVSQAIRQGTSISRVLESQAKLARSEHYAAMLTKVNRLAAKLVAPIFGIMLLIIVIALVPPIYDTVGLFMDAYSQGGVDTSALNSLQ